MKIFSAEQVRRWDATTIRNEPVSAVNLMERAATACFNWLTQYFKNPGTYTILCGTGNNGGDGLALARMLLQAGDTVSIFILEGEKRSDDFKTNLERIEPLTDNLLFIKNADFQLIPKGTVVIDALLGSGLSRPLQGLMADLVSYINVASKTIISIDIPTGLADNSIAAENVVMRASHTLSFQVPKLAFFIPGHKVYTGIIHLLDIGLDKQFYDDEPAQFSTLDPQYISSIFKSRNQFAHKYNFGHALLYAGSKNMMGAAILCAKGCLRSGAGLVTVSVEDGTQLIVQTALPEAITSTEIDPEKLSVKKSAIGIGPGFELSRSNNDLLYKLISGYNGPLVIDASALSILASGIDGFQHRKKQQPVVLTPHTGEFEKLFGKDDNDLERIHTARRRSLELGCYVILKGHHTLIACPDGQVFFNTTGNAGMATAGSGDVLTGMLTGLLAQGYSPTDACLLGVYLHGTAGDAAAEKMSQEAMIAGDIIDCIGEAFKKLRGG